MEAQTRLLLAPRLCCELLQVAGPRSCWRLEIHEEGQERAF